MNELAKVLHYYSLFEDNSTYKIICPFHEDINPSMLVDLHNNSFYCFGCNVSGDAFKFVKLMNPKLNDLQASIKFEKILRSRKQIKLKTKTVIKYKDNRQALTEAKDYYYGLSKTNWYEDDSETKKYLKKRGFTCYALSISQAKINYNNAYPVIFPMIDNGEFKGWVCRTTNSEVEKKRKYLYNTGFSRRSTLVGNYNSKIVVLVEGYMDWLKFRQYGKKNVAAILGWKITANQIEKLKKAGVKTIISALDNDTCGKNGTNYLKKFFNVIDFQYPENIKDPGEMNRKTFKESMKKTIELRRKQNGLSRRN